MSNGTDALSRMKANFGGRSSTGFGGLARKPKPEPSGGAGAAASDPSTAAASEELICAQDPATATTQAPAPAADQPSPSAAPFKETKESGAEGENVGTRPASGTRLPRNPPAMVGSVLAKLTGGVIFREDEGMERKTIALDRNVADYIQERVAREKRENAEAKNQNLADRGQRITLVSVLRTAAETPLAPEMAKIGKKLLSKRHEQFGSWRTNVELPDSTMAAIRVEMMRYGNRNNPLTEVSVVELRIAAWAASQEDWVEG